ncbi:MAG: ATP-binding cassette domain-containing protein [bacterium]|nr:ATP-binding cassette domain-containing protein [bacterium]
MISVKDIHKRFGKQIVLNGISHDFMPGKITTVVGPSGVGKSVLLKLILGILVPEKGDILIEGHSITLANTEAEKNEIRANLGVLFQSAALFDSLTVYDNIAFPLVERTYLSRPEIHEKVSFMLEALSLQPYYTKLPQEISLGMRKRVGMARSLIMEPKVLLIDEPNTGLDPLVGQEVYDLIKLCHSQWKFTGVVISHELPEVFQVSDRMIMLLNGKIHLEGTPQDFIDSTDLAVQQFIQGRLDGPITIQ